MNVSFYNKDNKGNILLSYETSSYNNIPRIGEKVVIKNKWYLVEDIVNIYIQNQQIVRLQLYMFILKSWRIKYES